MLNIATNEKAVTGGKFFDLMYVNPTSADFNADRQYVFLRSNEDDLMIVLANFSDENSDCKINIPQHAFDYLNLKKGIMEGTDLLNGEKIAITLSDTDPLNLSVEAWSGRVIKISKRIKQ